MRLFTPFTVLGLVFCLVVDLSAQSLRVVFVSGQASIQRPEEPALRPAQKGETIVIGTRIETGADGRVVLTPMAGIKSIITPNTKLLLEDFKENRTSATNVTQTAVLDLKEGAVVSDLQKPEGVTYDYSVRTARGLAGARGTTYTVGITPAGVQTIVVAHGTIALSFPDGRKGSLAPGQLSVTKANGTTQQVSSVAQLSADDKKVAQSVTETTVVAIASAVESGIAVAPEAMKNSVAAAKNLGVTLSPEASAAATSALEKPPAKQDKEETQAKDDKTAEAKDDKTAEVKSTEQAPPPAADTPPPTAAGSLPPADGGTPPPPSSGTTPPPPAPAPTAPAPSLFNTLSQVNVATPPPVGTIKPTDVISQTVTDPVAAFRSLLTTATQQSGFDALPSSVKLQLANRNNLSFAAFVLALPANQLAPFFLFSTAIQTQLAGRNESALTSLALQLSEAQITSLLQLSATTQNQLIAQGTPSFAAFALQLTEAQITLLLARPATIQGQFVTLNDPELTAFALTHLNDNGLPLLDEDIRTYLSATLALPTTSRQFLNDLAGPGFVNISSTPDPRQWTAAAFARTLASWNALAPGNQTLIIELGAGESIMDTSVDYIQALLSSLPATTAPNATTSVANTIALIKAAGWGRYLGELAGKPTGVSTLNEIIALTPAELSVIKDFDISTDLLNGGYSFGSNSAKAAISALAVLAATDRLTLKQIGVGQRIIYSYGLISDPAAAANDALAFYNGLAADEKTAALALDLGGLFLKPKDAPLFAIGSTTALERVQALTAFYIEHPALQQSIQVSRILSFDALPIDFLNASGSHLSLVDTIALFANLPAPTRLFLANSGHEDKQINFYELANPLFAPGETSTALRSLPAINDILTGLTDPEFSTFLELGGSQALLFEDINPAVSGIQDALKPVFSAFNGTDDTTLALNTPLQTLKNLIASYNAINAAHPYVLRELGIVGEGNIAAIGADTAGLERLVTAYDTAGGALRASTERLDEGFASFPPFGDTTHSSSVTRSFFFPGTYGNSGETMLNVQFHSGGDLYVGATRFLKINNSDLSSNPAFTVGASKALYLHAADLIDLTGTSTKAMFSTEIRSITMAAATINLTNVNFPERSVASLNSKLGGVNFGTVKIPGRVNFQDVTYGSEPLFFDSGAPAQIGGARGNIAIGTLASPATMPTYTPPRTAISL